MKKNNQSKVYQFLHDEKFIEWVLRPTDELETQWNSYINLHPSEKKDIKKAISTLKEMHKPEGTIQDEEIDLLWSRIDNTIQNEKSTRPLWYKWAAAASILIIIGVGGLFILNNTPENEIDYSQIAKVEPTSNDVVLILADESRETFSSDKVEIKYDEEGNIDVDNSNVQVTKTTKPVNEEEQLNQIVVPYGKHSFIVLSDGTKMWLNSGSRAIYPTKFVKNERQIFVEGEAYLEVTKDPNHRFIVKTNDIDVKVLGTKFNISSYPDDTRSSVVLLEGSVEASVNNNKIKIKPNEIFNYEKQTNQSEVSITNAIEHISWIDGWLLCKTENMADILIKLSRYYNININILDEQVRSLTLSGKLDLKGDCEEVIKAIATTAPISFKKVDNEIQITLNNN